MSKHKMKKLNKLNKINNRVFTNKELYELNRFIKETIKYDNIFETSRSMVLL